MELTLNELAVKTLKVILFQQGDCWIAQGLEIDYVAYGKTIQEAKSNFEKGFNKTIELNLKLQNPLIGFIRPAPAEAWQKYFTHQNQTLESKSHISIDKSNVELDFLLQEAA